MFELQRFTTINEFRVGTTNFEVYEDGTRYLGISTIDLPEFALRTVDVNGAGIAGEMQIPVAGQAEDMEMTIHWREVSNRFMGLLAYKAHNLTFRSAQHLYDVSNGNIAQEALKIVVRGIPKKGGFGKLEQAAETESESVLGLDYIKIWVDGQMQMEFDRFNHIWRVRHNGKVVDYLADVRRATGLGGNASTQSTEVVFSKG